MSKGTRRRFPGVLANELSAAMKATRGLGPELRETYLAAYREWFATTLVEWLGLAPEERNDSFSLKPPPNIPLVWLPRIVELDRAFDKLHRFRDPGGPEEYLAKTVASAATREWAGKKRDRRTTHDHDEIAKYLKRRDYLLSDNKKAILLDATQHFDCSKGTIYTVIRRRLQKTTSA